MKKILFILALFVFLNGNPLFSQLEYTFPQFGRETIEFAKQPVKWKGDDYLKMGLIAAGTVGLMFADLPVRNAVQKDHKYYYSFPIEFGRVWGDLPSPIVMFTGLATYSLITGDKWSRKVAYEIGQSALYAGGVVFLMKIGFGRARPYMEEGNTTFKPFNSILIQDYHSIPGGHTTAAFTVSTILSRNVKPLWLKIAFYVPAVLTYASRIYQDKHWVSDNLLGASLGFFIATWVVDHHEKVITPNSKDNKQTLMERIQFQPMMYGDFYGVNVAVRLF